MDMKMPVINQCDANQCAYNSDNQCHAMAITIGDGNNPLCDTAFKYSTKGGVPKLTGGVGACKVTSCMFNKSLECSSEGIEVKMHSNNAECNTFQAK